MSKTLKLALGLYVLLFSPAAALAQIPGTDDPDYKEVLAYRLTIPALTKVMQATQNMAEAARSDPRFIKQAALKEEIKTLEEKEERTEAEETRLEKLRADAAQLEERLNPADSGKTLSDMAAAIEKEPLAAKALAGAGISARDYAKFLLAYFQAGMVAGMIKQGLVKEVPNEMAGSINMENVKFVQEHEAELEAFAKAMKALEKPNR